MLDTETKREFENGYLLKKWVLREINLCFPKLSYLFPKSLCLCALVVIF